MTFFRTHPVLLGFTVFAIIAGGLFILFGVLMHRNGLSLRPLVFLGVFFGLIIGPQLIGHILQARGVIPNLNQSLPKNFCSLRENEGVLKNRDGKFLEPEKVFGAGFDPQLVADMRPLFAALTPEAAQSVVFPNMETALVARFATAETAWQALAFYEASAGLSRGKPAPDGTFTAARAGDRVRFVVAGKTFFVWSGADNAALNRRQQASAAAFIIDYPSPPDPRIARTKRALILALPVLVLGCALWFFKGSTWAATVTPASQVALPMSAGQLRAQLLSIENLQQPVTVSAGKTFDEIVVTWRADAAWLTHAQAAGLKRTHKLVLHLDETSHTVRVREYMSALDWSAAPNRAAVQWHMKTGIVFFEYRHERVLGLQLDPATGRFKPELSYAYTFNLQELKAPAIAAVTHAGWTWKPVLWKGPSWLRWAIE